MGFTPEGRPDRSVPPQTFQSAIRSGSVPS